MAVKDCCQNEDNLKVEVPSDVPGTVMLRCVVCRCRHFEAAADAGVYAMTGKGVS